MSTSDASNTGKPPCVCGWRETFNQKFVLTVEYGSREKRDDAFASGVLNRAPSRSTELSSSFIFHGNEDGLSEALEFARRIQFDDDNGVMRPGVVRVLIHRVVEITQTTTSLVLSSDDSAKLARNACLS